MDDVDGCRSQWRSLYDRTVVVHPLCISCLQDSTSREGSRVDKRQNTLRFLVDDLVELDTYRRRISLIVAMCRGFGFLFGLVVVDEVVFGSLCTLGMEGCKISRTVKIPWFSESDESKTSVLARNMGTSGGNQKHESASFEKVKTRIERDVHCISLASKNTLSLHSTLLYSS